MGKFRKKPVVIEAVQWRGTPTIDAIRALAADSDRLISGLMRHLEDEEDLIVPLVLERGEAELGVG